MNIFLSYASEQAAIAESIEVALSGEGHDVFRDRSDLPSGEAYHARIREAIAASDLFVFLVSPEAVSAGRYTLTELELAREKWRNPSGRVLPVVVAPTPRGSIPTFLNGVTSLSPAGNMPASVAAAVASLGRPGMRGALRPWVAVLALALVVGVGFTIRWAAERSRLEREVSDLRLSAKVQSDAGAYAGAWDLYAKAAELAPQNDDVTRSRERLAMDWLENIRVTVGGGTFTAIVDKVAPVLAGCAATNEAPRAADCHAHLGWADVLRAREGAGGLNPIAHYQRALKIERDNVYAHTMWGHELLRTPHSIAEARARFDAALASGRERSFVRLMQLSGLLSGTNAELENEAVRVVNDMRKNGEAIPGGPTTTAAAIVGRLWNVYLCPRLQRLRSRTVPRCHHGRRSRRDVQLALYRNNRSREIGRTCACSCLRRCKSMRARAKTRSRTTRPSAMRWLAKGASPMAVGCRKARSRQSNGCHGRDESELRSSVGLTQRA